jgi:spore germination protein GerM
VRRIAVFVLGLATLVAACQKKSPSPSSNLNVANQVAMRSVRLYYESPDMLLVPETRNVQLPQNPAAAMSLVVRELFKGSASAAVPRLFPADTVVRGAYLLPDGTALVDLGGATLSQGWATGSHQELMAVYSLVQTVAVNFPDAKRVRLLVNGEPTETLAGHISLQRSLSPSASVLDPRLK